jgi:hypothetical protein
MSKVITCTEYLIVRETLTCVAAFRCRENVPTRLGEGEFSKFWHLAVLRQAIAQYAGNPDAIEIYQRPDVPADARHYVVLAVDYYSNGRPTSNQGLICQCVDGKITDDETLITPWMLLKARELSLSCWSLKAYFAKDVMGCVSAVITLLALLLWLGIFWSPHDTRNVLGALGFDNGFGILLLLLFLVGSLYLGPIWLMSSMTSDWWAMRSKRKLLRENLIYSPLHLEPPSGPWPGKVAA